MAVEFFGAQFPLKDPLGTQEKWITQSILQQIDNSWPNHNNLVISTTWLGPAFDSWENFVSKDFVCDNLFWLCVSDHLCMSQDDFRLIENKIGAKSVKYIGHVFDGDYFFNTSAIAILEDFPNYSLEDIALIKTTHRYLCYNRKPRPHRQNLVQKIINEDLQKHGVVTLGDRFTIQENRNGYNTKIQQNLHFDKFNIPLDIVSLGRLDIWQNHFLNVVSETEFFPWDNLLVSEKTWKPIIGLRPFVINGQPQIYSWLRKNGFKTFNHYWNFVDLENCNELEIHDNLIQVIKYVCSLPEGKLHEIYKQMLPDLQHNRQRFFEYANEQKQRIQSLF